MADKEQIISSQIIRRGSIVTQGDRASKNYATNISTEQIDLCTRLTASTENFSTQGWIILANGFLNQHDRFQYADISNFVFDLCRDEAQETIFFTNLDKVYEYIYSKTPIEQKKLRGPKKFCDHAKLAQHQSHLVTSARSELEVLVNSKVEQAVLKTTSEMSSQLVSLVAIFTALSFILFGGISSLQSIFSFLDGMINDHSRWFAILPPIIVASLWGFCMINMLFVFVLFILRIINRPLHNGEPDDYSGRMTFLETMRRFPILVLVDYILLVLISCFLLLYMAAVSKAGSQLISSITGLYGGAVFIVVGLIIILSLIILGHLIRTRIFRIFLLKKPSPNGQ